MLLIEKAANRIVRQKPDEIRASLALPIALVQHQEYQVQVSVSISIPHHLAFSLWEYIESE